MNTIWRIISIAGFGLLVYQVFFQNNSNSATDTQILEPNRTDPFCYYIAEEMPRFPGCEDLSLSKDELYQCANKKLFEFIYSNLKYPPIDAHVEGMIVVQFTVEKDGRLTDTKVIKGFSPSIEKELIRLVDKMPRWIPGRQSGKEVRVRFNLPVKIRLE